MSAVILYKKSHPTTSDETNSEITGGVSIEKQCETVDKEAVIKISKNEEKTKKNPFCPDI